MIESPLSAYAPLQAAFEQGVSIILERAEYKDKDKALRAWMARYGLVARMTGMRPLSPIDVINLKEWVASQKIDLNDPYQTQVILAASLKTVGEYRARLLGAVEGLISGEGAGFVSTFARTIDVQLTQAWNKGANAIGVAPDEMTDRDMKVLNGIIKNENSFILGLADEIKTDKASGMEPDKMLSKYGARVDVWANRYLDTVNQAILYFGAKVRMVWKLGDREKHCSTCPRLDGIVAFGEEWSKSGFHPQRPPNGKLECGGWNCGCSCLPTKQRRSTNALKRLQAIAGGG